MDRRTLLAIVLSMAIYYAWMLVRGPQLQAESEALEAAEAAAVQVEPSATAQPAEEPVRQAPLVPQTTDVPAQQSPFAMCGAQGTISSVGGLSTVTLDNHLAPLEVQPLYTWIWGKVTGTVEGGWHPWGEVQPGRAEVLTKQARVLAIGSGAGPGTSPPTPLTIQTGARGGMTLRGRTESGLAVTQVLRELPADERGCLIDVELTWHNPAPIPHTEPVWIGLHDVASSGAGGMTARYSSLRQPTAVTDEALTYGGPTGAGCVRDGTRLTDEETQFPLEGPVSWFGVSDRYFGMYLMPEDPAVGQVWFSRLGAGEEALDGVHLRMDTPLAAGATRVDRFQAYLGPNDMDELTAAHAELSRVVDLGWFAFFGYPLLALLRWLYGVVGNWGWSIVLLTVLVKAAFFPITQRAFRSMQKMQKIQPELTKIREEMKDNPQEMNKRVLAVMQENKVNPAGGCLPMIIQMPVWVALYNVLLTSVELYHTEFLYLKDLTQPDPYLVLPLTIMVLMFVQQQFNTPTNMDPAQQQVMRFMPLFFGLMFFAFPSGLAVYMFVNMVLSNLQQWLIKRGMRSDDDASAAPTTEVPSHASP